jgi:predicted TIM-barrel fold metal-dependent hydrolase
MYPIGRSGNTTWEFAKKAAIAARGSKTTPVPEAGAGQPETDSGMPVIDFHIHTAHYQSMTPSYSAFLREVWGDELENMIRTYSSPELFLQLLDECGIDAAVILAEVSPITTGIVDNVYVAGFCAPSPRLIPFVSINPYLTANLGEELGRWAHEGFRGVKLYPTYQHFYPNDARLYPLYARAQELRLPVMFHVGSSVFAGSRLKYGDPLLLDDVASDFPELAIVQSHSGRPFWYEKAFALARLHRNVYMEVAGLPPQKLLTYFPELERVADKVIYGSDWPAVRTLKENTRAIRALPLNAGAKEKILGGNAARILRL